MKNAESSYSAKYDKDLRQFECSVFVAVAAELVRISYWASGDVYWIKSDTRFSSPSVKLIER
ncbi:MAG: hypothetical protein ACI945_000988 [Pseudohongiellaceae bacterium]|jgi:hypothetical protein